MKQLDQYLSKMRWVMLAAILPMCGQGLNAQDLSEGLVAYWSFDNNNFQDEGPTGTYNGEGQGSADIEFGSGPSAAFGDAMILDGVDQFVQITGGELDELSFSQASSVDANATGKMTVSTWFRVESFDVNWQALIAQGEGGRWRIHRSGGSSVMAVAGGNGDTPGEGPDVSDGEWHHLAAVVDVDGLSDVDGFSAIYIDGEVASVNTAAPNLEVNPNDSRIMIGENPDARNRYWNGGVDDVAIWRRALSSAEIAQLAAGPLKANFVKETTITILGTGADSLIGGDLTDPEDDGDESGEDMAAGWNWVSIESNIEPGFGGGEFSYNIFDNAVGGGNDKWCCDDPTDDNPYWVAVQFEKPIALTHFTITSGNDTPNRDPIRWAIQGSNDGESYSDVYNYNEETSFYTDRNQVALIELAEASEQYTYFRYIVYHTPGNLHQINEIELFGCPGGCGQPVFAGTSKGIDSFSARVKDGSDTALDPETVILKIDGAVVSHTVSKTGDTSSINYSSDSKFPSKSAHTWEVIAADTAGNALSASGKWTTEAYGLLTANHKVNADKSKPGFMVEIHQNEAFQANNHQRAIDQLNGVLGENFADPFFFYVELGEGSPGSAELPAGYTGVITFENDGVINYNQDDGGAAGEFDQDSGIPGVPGFTSSTDGIAGRFTTYAELPAGRHTFIVNSDDGFFTSVGVPGDVFLSSIAGEFEGGRGAADTAFPIIVEEDGIYPITTVWYEGGGGANIEIKTEKADGTRVLLNDTSNGGFASYRATSDGTPAKVTSVSPGIGATGVAGNANVTLLLADGDVSVDTGSVNLMVNGEDVGASVSKSDGLTTVTAVNNGVWASGSSNSATLSFTAGGSTRTHTWNWTVADYPTLTKGVTAPGSGGEAGFEFRIYQTDAGRGNSTNDAEAQLAGTWDDGAENVADPAGGTESSDSSRPGIIFDIAGVINFDQDGAAQGVFRDSGDGSSTDRADENIPGIPGLGANPTDNMSAEILTFIEFPAAGYYEMIFNSDDGFLVSETHGAGDDRGTTLGVFNGGRGAADTQFGFAVPEAGVYPIRAIWYEGGGGANLEWSSIVGGTRYLINDANGNALKAYRTRDESTIHDVLVAGPGGGSITSVALSDGNVDIEYTGTLKSADSVTGPYSDVAGASSPYSVAPTKAAEFYISE
jgi:hypothetical protein